MSSPKSDTWADRRALFQPGRAVHEPAAPRQASISKSGSPPASPASPTTTTATTASASSPGRRRSSASGGAGMFANLHSQKRGSQDYGARQQNWADMSHPKGTLATAFEKFIKK